MAFTFDTKKNIVDPNITIIMYDYFGTVVYKSTKEYSTINTAGVQVPQTLSIQYKPVSSSPNVTYPDPNTAYTASKMYFTGLIHNNIQDVTCDGNGAAINPNIIGEMIIENSKLTGSGKCYLCFLLQSDSNPILSGMSSNDIDDIIGLITAPSTDLTQSISVTLNGVLTVQNSGVSYKDNGNNVFVFTTPVSINSASNNIIKQCLTTTTLFGKAPPSPGLLYSSLKGDSIKLGKVDDIYIDCQPTGESAETINTYQLPINSDYVNAASNIFLQQTVTQLCIVFSFLAVSYFALPIVYKMVIINNVNKFVLNDEKPKLSVGEKTEIQKNRETAFSTKYFAAFLDHKPDIGIDTFVRIASIDCYIFIICLFLFVLVLTKGFSSETDTISAVYLMVFFVMGFANIKINKLNKEFMVTDGFGGYEYPPEPTEGKSINYFEPGDIAKFLMDSMNFALTGPRAKWFLVVFAIATIILQATVWGLNSTNPATMPTNLAVLLSMSLQIVILLGTAFSVLSYTTRGEFYKADDAPPPGGPP